MSAIPSKLSEIYLFKQDEKLFHGQQNSFYFREYARKWAEYRRITVFVKYPDSSFYPEAQLVNCKTGASVSAYIVSFLITAGLYKIIMNPNVLIPADDHYYAIIYTRTGSVFIYNTQYISTTPYAGNITVNSTRWTGIQVVMKSTCVLYDLQVEVSYPAVMASSILYEVYRVNSANLKDARFLFGGEIQKAGASGTEILTIPLDTNNESNRWANGDVLMVLMLCRNANDSFVYGYGNWPPVQNGWTVYKNLDGAMSIETTSSPYITIRGYDCLFSEFLTQSTDRMYELRYSNLNEFDNLPANQEMATCIDISMWQQEQPQEYEDIEIAPGQFTRVRSEIYKKFKLETNYLPGYAHDQLQTILGSDNLKINNVEFIQRDQYQVTFGRHYGMAKGSVKLTERNSILKNVI